MNFYMIAFDFLKSRSYYKGFFEVIKKHYDSCYMFNSNWIIKSTEDADAVWKRLEKYIHLNDEIFICRIDRDYAGFLNEDTLEFLEKK